MTLADQCRKRGRPLWAHAKHRTTSPPPSSRQGHYFPPEAGTLALSVARYAAASFDQENSVPSTHMRCKITASLRATATLAFLSPLRLAIRRPQALSADHFGTRI